MKELAMVLLCLILTVRCAEFESMNEDKKKEKRASVNSQDLANYIQVKVEPTSKPEVYAVYFSWPKIEEDKRVRIRLTEVLALVGPNQTTFSHEVSHDQTLTYVFDILGSANKVEKSYSKLVKVPLDLVFNNQTRELSEDLKLTARRAFFLSKSPLITNGFKVELTVDELISDSGEIQTFVEGLKAGPGKAGRTAGDITIKAKSAAGKLRIINRGQSGGDGIDGAAHPLAAASGVLPGPGQEKCSCDRNCMKNSSGGNCVCEKSGAPGGKGADGLQGLAGGDAGAGGSTGKLLVSVIDGREFQLENLRLAGKAGVPGKGGPGQPGGSGGVATKKIVCAGPTGPSGLTGKIGESGKAAPDGKEDPICIYIASEEKNDCR